MRNAKLLMTFYAIKKQFHMVSGANCKDLMGCGGRELNV
jgi:hypothetical protein